MSALPPKADVCGATTDVCFGPKADIEVGLALSPNPAKSVTRVVTLMF
jgi:hypothetical protein